MRIMRVSQLLFAVALVFAGKLSAQNAMTIRVGHFPNVTHVQALVAHALSRQGKGWFEERLGPGAKIDWFVYNAGPSAMEAIFANSIDLTSVGPSPAINPYAKSRGEWGRGFGGATRSKPEDPGRFPGQENRNTAARKHSGRFLPRLVERRRI